jgi:hypothetical protein
MHSAAQGLWCRKADQHAHEFAPLVQQNKTSMHNSCVGKVLAEELQGEKKSCEDRHGAGHKAQSQLRFSRLICMLAAAKQHAAMSRSPMWWR